MMTTPNTNAPSIPTFDDVVTRFEHDIYRLFMQLTSNRTQADELYNELLVNACNTFGDLDGTTDHRAWLFNLATGVYLRRQATSTGNRPLKAVMGLKGMDGPDADREVDAFINILPPKQRAALVLRKYHGLGYAEIGQSLNSSEGAARAMAYSALRTLVERFGDRI